MPEGAESSIITFPQIVDTLVAAAFDGYLVDLRLGNRTYYLQDGNGLVLPARSCCVAVAVEFNVDEVKGRGAAILP